MLWFACGFSILIMYGQLKAGDKLATIVPSTPSTFAQLNEFPVKLASIQTTQKVLAGQWHKARTAKEKKKVIKRARNFVVKSIVEDIFPVWMGTPWHMGEDDDALMPHQEGKRVSCSMFVTAVLQNIGLRLDSRLRWAQAPALYIQRSLAPKRKDLQRYFSIEPKLLAQKLGRLDDGLYVIGLNCHVGFILVENGEARFVHSNYVEPEEGVTDEPVADSAAISNSQGTGYWVTPVFQDERLIRHWLNGTEVPLQKLGQ